MLFFSSYEYSKAYLVNAGMQDFMAYLSAGLVGDLFASSIYVPSEVFFSLESIVADRQGCEGETAVTGLIQ